MYVVANSLSKQLIDDGRTFPRGNWAKCSARNQAVLLKGGHVIGTHGKGGDEVEE